MADRYPRERDRAGSDPIHDRSGVRPRATDEVRSGLGDDEAARRRRMDEAERDRWEAEACNRRMAGRDDRSRAERSYSFDRPYGDRDYGWRDTHREYESPGMAERDYGGRAREWSSTEGWRVPGPHAGRGPKGYQRSDDRIRDEINDRLTAHGLIDATDVECRVQNGEVMLTGFVDSRAAKRAAEDLAEDTYGVRDVHNQLRVRSHASDEGVGRTSVLGLTESQTQTTHPTGAPAKVDQARPRTRI